MKHPSERHPLIQIPIDLACIAVWFVVVIGVPAYAAWSAFVLIFLR